jgi:type II secretory pathway pseudopilin PulG
MEEVDWTEIAAAGGVQDYMNILREVEQEERAEQQAIQQAERAEQQAAQQKDKNQQTANANKLAEQYPDYPDDVMSLFIGKCEENWGCVRKTLREQENTQADGPSEQENTQADGPSEKDNQTALQIAAKYGIDDQVVLDQFNDCGGDWGCTRSYFREQSMKNKETGKPDK